MPVEKFFKLTAEGRLYLECGLPEKNLIDFINSNPKKSVKIEKAIVHVKNFPVALKWAMEKGWVDREGSELFLAKMPQEIPEQDALAKIDKGKLVDEGILNVLLQRRLVEKIIVGEVDKLVGREVTNLTPELIKTGIWKRVRFKPYNVEVAGKKVYAGKRHPYNQFLWKVRKKLVELGFREMTGPTIEMEFWNFDALYQPQNHPARDWAQTYSIKDPKFGSLPTNKIVGQVKSTHENGWKTGSSGWGYDWGIKKASQLMPRAHDTAISPRYMAKGLEIPGKYFSLVRCYRPDVIDVKHGVEFYQMGGIVLGENLNFKHLLGLLKTFVKEIAGIGKIKFATAYFPFTEPSCEILGKHPELGWTELAGSGIFRPELTLPLGIDVPVIAWGFGVDRLAMHNLGINDIRELFTRNLEWLRSQKVVM